MLENSEYWGDPGAALYNAYKENVILGNTCLEIFGPQTVDLKARTSAPVVLMWVETLAKMARTPFKEITTATMIRLEDNQLFAGDLFEYVRGRERDLPLENEQPEGHSGELKVIDLHKRLGLDWQPGTYLVTVLLRDQSSNRLQMEFKQGESAYVDPAVEEYYAEQRSKPMQRSIWPDPGNPLPSYKSQNESPPLPDDVGIALECDRLTILRPESKAKVHGSFRLPVLAGDILPEPTIDGVGAVIPISLVITRSEARGATVLPLTVPIYGNIPSGGKAPVVTGYFNFNLLTISRVSVEPQTLFISAYYGESMVGPIPMALVADDQGKK